VDNVDEVYVDTATHFIEARVIRDSTTLNRMENVSKTVENRQFLSRYKISILTQIIFHDRTSTMIRLHLPMCTH
jgi:hypothetical protein